jgi:hypothetical protein
MRFLFLFIIVALLGFNNVSHSQNPDKTKNIENKKDKKKKDVGNTREVIAEGVGDTPDNSLKNAYRNAVRQVVGSIVDEKILLNNDKLIEEKVLQFSNDFVKSKSEIEGSKKVEMKIHKIRIKIVIDIKAISEKLKTNNITIIETSGQFASRKDNIITKKESTFLAEGTGRSPEEALLAAYRNAIYQVVGAIVDSETLIKNDVLIEDKILTYSNGFVTGHKEVSKSNKNGIHSIKILAEVKVTGVREKINISKISLASFDGKSVGDKMISDIEKKAASDAQIVKNTKEGAELIVKKLNNFNRNLLKIETVIDQKDIQVINKEANLKCNISFELDKTLYSQFRSDLKTTLSKMADKKKEISFECKANNRKRTIKSFVKYYEIPDFLKIEGDDNQYLPEAKMDGILDLLINTRNDIIPAGGFGIVLTNSFTANMKTSNSEIFTFPKDFYEEISKASNFNYGNNLFKCKISLLDDKKATVVFKTFKIPSFLVLKKDANYGLIFISNHFIYNDHEKFYNSPKIVSTVTFKLDPRDIAKIKTAKVEFVDE